MEQSGRRGHGPYAGCPRQNATPLLVSAACLEAGRVTLWRWPMILDYWQLCETTDDLSETTQGVSGLSQLVSALSVG